MINKAICGAIAGAVVGFIAPISVALVSGVKFGTYEAGTTVFLSWVCAILAGGAMYDFLKHSGIMK